VLLSRGALEEGGTDSVDSAAGTILASEEVESTGATTPSVDGMAADMVQIRKRIQ
jgi:hypothetical protein